MVICLTGFMGCGKSSTGAALAKLLNRKFIDLDDYVQECEGLTVTQLFALGQERFREAESRCLRQILARADEDFVLALGGGTLESESNQRLVLEKTRCIYLEASLPIIRERLKNSGTERPLFSPETVGELYNSRIDLYRKAELTVRTDSLSAVQVAKHIAELLSVECGD